MDVFLYSELSPAKLVLAFVWASLPKKPLNKVSPRNMNLQRYRGIFQTQLNHSANKSMEILPYPCLTPMNQSFKGTLLERRFAEHPGYSLHVKLWSYNWASQGAHARVISIFIPYLSLHLFFRTKGVDQACHLNFGTLGHGNATGMAALAVNNLEAPDLHGKKQKVGISKPQIHMPKPPSPVKRKQARKISGRGGEQQQQDA